MKKYTYKSLSVILASVMVTALFIFVPFSVKAEVLPYQDTNLTFEERAADLISRMTLTQKQNQLGNNAGAIQELGVKAYNYWSEALHGVARKGEATSFPSPFSMASSWDTDLMLEIASATSTEARGYYAWKKTNNIGLSYWSPTINLARDPRWGRNEENFGEDPFLTAAMGEQFINGMQGTNDNAVSPVTGEKYLKTISTIKHYAANNNENGRNSGTSNMDDRTLRNYYTWAFKEIAQRTPVGSVMSAYNRVNGIPASANTYLLDTLLRKTWGFDGYVVSDCDAVSDIFNNHKWVPEGWDHVITPIEATALSIQAGTDLNCGSTYQNQTINSINAGLMTEDEMDVALLRLFTARMQTGEFDPVGYVSYNQITQSVIEAPDHLELAKQSARESIILLKNDKMEDSDKNILPIDLSTVNSIAVFGPLAEVCELGDYSGSPTTRVSFKQGIENYLEENDITADIKFYDGIGEQSAIPSNLLNFRSVNFGSVTRTAISADVISNMQKESNNLGYVKDGSYAVFKNINITDMTTVILETAAPAEGSDDTDVEVRIGGLNGPLVATINCNRTGGWQTYQSFTGTADIGENSGVQDIYLIFTHNTGALIQEDIDNARSADIAIVFVGTTAEEKEYASFKIASEGRDRSSLRLPAAQDTLISAVAKLNSNTVVAIQSVGMHDLNRFKDSVKAITYNNYNGQFQGTALAETLFGDNNPGGKLPITWYADEAEIPSISTTVPGVHNYTIRAEDGKLGRTYMHFQGQVEYPFGYGLSYTTFTYSDIAVSEDTVADNETFEVTLKVKNNSEIPGAEVVQVYVEMPGADENPDIPKKQLKGFKRVWLGANEEQEVSITIDASDFAMVLEDDGNSEVTPGEYKIMVGSSCEDIEETLTVEVKSSGGPVLQNLTFRAGRVVAKADVVFDTELTVTMSDESFYDISQGGITVSYSSGNDNVATVDPSSGVVTTVGDGVTTIEVSVIIDGVELTESFPIVVKDMAYVDNISVDGEPLQGFVYNKYVYEYTVPFEHEGIPEITYDLPAGMTASVTYPDKIPGNAVVKIQKGSLNTEYTIKLAYPPDDFTYEVMTFKRFDINYTGNGGGDGVGKMLYADWKQNDSDAPVNLKTHFPEKLFLRMKINLAATSASPLPADINSAFNGGVLRIRSPHTNGGSQENYWGWTFNSTWNFKLGDNYIDIPLETAIALEMGSNNNVKYGANNKNGEMDWEAVNQIFLYFTVNQAKWVGINFSMTISDTKIVDITLEEELAALTQITASKLSQGEYTDVSYAAYSTAFDNAKALINDPDVTVSLIRNAVIRLQAAIDGLSTSTVVDDRKKGDVNDDDAINIFDIMLIRDHIFGKSTLEDEDFTAADVNGDEDVNIFDIMLIRDYIFGKVTTLS